jgi:REase_MTES_1575
MSLPVPDNPDQILAGHPFTPADARVAGISANSLRRLLGLGIVRSVCYGVYVDSGAEDSLPLRAAAVAKVAPPDAVICRGTAAWLYGVDTLALQELNDPPVVDSVRPTSVRALKLSATRGHSQTLLDGDVVEWHGLRVTSPLATAVHLARHLPRPFGLSALDAMARAELIALLELRDAVRRYPHHPGIVQARELAGLVDPAAESPGESWLRLRMVDGGFPHPVPQVVVSDGERDYRVDLGFLDPMPGTTRRLALEYDSDQWHSTPEQRAADELRRKNLDRLGWDVMSVRRWQILGDDASLERAVGERLGMEPRLPRLW